MGNICRSPAAEGIFAQKVRALKLDHQIEWDSAGTIGFHSGARADGRMRATAGQRGYSLDSLSRQIRVEDLRTFDRILTMDNANYNDVVSLDRTGEYRSKIIPICRYCTRFQETEIPDPYYGGNQGFNHVMDLLEDACDGLIHDIRSELNVKG
jgi:protein-tyrosine phosphatase